MKNVLYFTMLAFVLSMGQVQASEEKVVDAKKVEYMKKAKDLGAKIKQGFELTAPKVPGLGTTLTYCLSKGSDLWAKWGGKLYYGDDGADADNTTEIYLRMGYEEGLDLDDRQAVEAFLLEKVSLRVGGKVQTGAKIIGGSRGEMVGKCVKGAGSSYYAKRLNQALDHAYGEGDAVEEKEELSIDDFEMIGDGNNDNSPDPKIEEVD
ncbi:MAG: hypothetical protein ACPGXY_05825 [Alphaproteobacteria bacterium]